MKATLLALICLAACAVAIEYSNEWRSFKRQHGKTYRSDADEDNRYRIYNINKKRIDDHNSMFALGLASYRMRMNRFGDLLQTEVNTLMNGFNQTGQLMGHKANGIKFLPPANVQLPQAVDWRQLGLVTRIKDQGRCASGWAFSVTGALEGQIARSRGTLIPLSEQNLIDCSSTFGNDGCNGGLMDNGFEYVTKNGLEVEDIYPYEGEAHFCRYQKSMTLAEAKGHVVLPANEEALRAAVATVGPIATAISAGNSGFTFYGGGILSGEACDRRRLDHAVLVVGYGSEKGQDFWILKNSWGSVWGEDGYIRLARGRGNLCGIASMASYPVM